MAIQNGKHLRVKADHGRDVHPLSEHKNFTKGNICEFLAFPFSDLMFYQTFSNLLFCLLISQQLHAKVAQTS